MATDADYISNGKAKAGGYIYAALKTDSLTIPTDATSELGSEFVNLGLVSEDGLTESIDVTSEDITDATGDVVATLDGGSKTTFQFTLISSTKLAALKQAFGESNVSGTDGGSVTAKHTGADAWVAYVYVYETVTRDGRIDRQVIPDGKAIERDDIQKAPGSTTNYSMTIHARKDSSGVTSYDYFAVPTTTTTTSTSTGA